MADRNDPSQNVVLQAVERSITRIAERDTDVHAWVQVDADGARQQARDCDAAAPLAGLTVGVKDIVQVKGLLCEFGSQIDRGNIAPKDSALVAELRERGAIIMGKTTTPEYAYLNPTPTRNPHDLSRSPGGSSSGSAAAVADGHVDMALGTQTAGSILRPASFCGVVGYKPTHGRISLSGVKCVSPTLDTIGWMTRDVATAAKVKEALIGASAIPSSGKIGFCRTAHWDKADVAMQSAVEAFAMRINAQPIASPPACLDIIHASIMRYEMRRELAPERLQYAALMSPVLREYLQSVIVSQSEYEQALDSLAAFDVDTLFGQSEIVITPAAPGEAVPFGTTGDPCFNRFVTLLGLPTISIPFAKGRNSLPLGLQLIGRRDQDDLLFATAAMFETLVTYDRAH